MQNRSDTGKAKGVTIRSRGKRYQVRWRQTGRECGKTFGSFEEAEALHDQLLARRGRGRSRGSMTITALFREWNRTRTHCAPQTRRRDITFTANYILRYFGNKTISEIEPWDVRHWVQFLLSGSGDEEIEGLVLPKLAPATVHKAVQLFSQALDYAVQESYVDSNVVAGVKVQGHTRALIEKTGFRSEPSHEAAACVVAALEETSPMNGVLGRLFCETGLRIGEALALDVRHLILGPDRYAVIVEQSWNTSEDLHHCEVGAVKTIRSPRTVPTLRPSTAELLLNLVDGKDLNSPVFCGPRGARLHPSNWRNRIFLPAARSIDPAIVPHDLRHYAISAWLEAGMDEWTAAKLAGHATPELIRRRYGHAIQKTKVAEARLCTALEQHRLDIERQILPIIEEPAAEVPGDEMATVIPLRPRFGA